MTLDEKIGQMTQSVWHNSVSPEIIQDRTIYEDAHIFAPNLHAMGLMTNRDYNNYSSLFELMEKFKFIIILVGDN